MATTATTAKSTTIERPSRRPGFFFYVWTALYCGVISTLMLLFFFFLTSGLTDGYLHFSNKLDVAFVLYLVAVAGGHTLAFLLPALSWLQRNRSKYSAPATLYLGITLSLVAASQLLWRYVAIGLRHIDCYMSCVDTVVPWNQDILVSVLTGLCLGLALTWILLRQRKRSLLS